MKKCILLLLVLFSACGLGETDKQISLNASSIVVSFGDSLTKGTGADAGEDYPSILSDLLGFKVINAGVSGETSDRGLRRIDAVLMQYMPDLVILMHGGNDILQRRPKQSIANNLAKIIKKIQNSGAKVILIGVPKFGIILNDLPLYQTLAERYGVIYVKGVLSELLSQPSYKSDTIHLNNKGYYALAKVIRKQIKVQ